MGPYDDVTSYHDHRWPKKCPHCDYEFQQSDKWRLNLDILMKRSDGGPMTTLREAPVGAMYWMSWFEGTEFVGPDGRALGVVCPGPHVWHVDARASNCTKPDDKKHKCWVRHGEVPNITVDKNGNTCNAGAGSSVVPGWHGFLRGGELVEC